MLALVALLLAAVGTAAYLYSQSWFSDDEVIEPAPCTVCGKTVRFKTRKGRRYAECSSCGAYERHRLMLHYISHREGLLDPGTSVLHFAPNAGIERYLRAREGLVYQTADLYTQADLELDLTAIAQPDASWDVVICYHVLEHVDDDRKAMSELFRILRPGGVAILQVPLEIGRNETDEDPSVTDPAERRRRFGQEDHVRFYGAADFEARLTAAGFEVEALDYIAQLGPEVVERHHLSREPTGDPAPDERIFVVTKPR
ncbi:MAG: class I SAM-dependent methyltransferase [Nannocystaceae bacterium]